MAVSNDGIERVQDRFAIRVGNHQRRQKFHRVAAAGPATLAAWRGNQLISGQADILKRYFSFWNILDVVARPARLLPTRRREPLANSLTPA